MIAALAVRRSRALGFAALALLLAGAALAIPARAPQPVRAAEVVIVDVADFAYQPATITIQVGDTIQWNNADEVDHTATSNPGTPEAFDVYLSAGAWGSYTFDTPGTYDYYCIPHPTMTGRIVVEPAPVASAAASSAATSVPDVAMSRPLDGSPAALAWLAAAMGSLLAAAAVLRRRHASSRNS